MASAARRVYDCVEIRRHILHQLPKSALARCMRLEKACLQDAAQELYHTLSYWRIWDKLPMALNGPKMLLRFVKHLIPTDPHSKPIWLVHEAQPSLCQTYSADGLNGYIRRLKSNLPHLQTISCGDRERWLGGAGEKDDWAVYFKTPSEVDDDPGVGGHVVVDRRRDLSLSTHPPAVLEKAVSPSSRYTITTRFHLTIYPPEPHSTFVAEWLAAFRRKPSFALPALRMKFGALPITLEDLTTLYRCQIESGQADLLQHIEADELGPWDPHDFETFVTTATSALRVLILYPQHENTFITSDDLPSFIPLVRDHLVNLETLVMKVRGTPSAAEAVCGAMLNERSLCDQGSINDLQITLLVPQPHPPTVFNFLRALSPLCTANASIIVHVSPSAAHYRKDGFLDYVRSQSAERRFHLSTVDFSTLGVTTLDHVKKLQYNDAGRPIRLEAA